MTIGFRLKRALVIFALAFAMIATAQYLKTDQLHYALTHAGIWAILSTALYLAVLWRKLKTHSACSARARIDRA